MCGIAGVHFKNPEDTGATQAQLETFVNRLLLGIEHRGKDATGMLTIDHEGRPNLVKADTKASTFIEWRDGVPSKPRTILLHTRLATQGKPDNLDNNHPVHHGTVYATHNGHISNDSALFASEKIERKAEVDSEIIPALFNKYGLDSDALDVVLPMFDGGFAIAVVDPTLYPDRTILAKGYSSPLEVWESKYAVVWASTTMTIQNALQEAFGFKPKFNKIKTKGTGDILILDGAEVTEAKFEAYPRYTYSAGSSCDTRYSGSRSWPSWADDDDDPTADTMLSGGHEAVGAFMAEECKNCLCERMYHGQGTDYDGPCIYITDEGFFCRCQGFVKKSRESTTENTANDLGLEICDGCGREFWSSNLKKVGQKRLCRYYCANDPAVSETVKALDAGKPNPPATGIKGKSMDQLADLVVEKMIEAEAEGTSTGDARDKAVSAIAAEMAALKTGMGASYVLWLVEDMTDQIMDQDESGYLKAALAEAGNAFYRAWNLLDVAVDEALDEVNDTFIETEALDENTTTEEVVA